MTRAVSLKTGHMVDLGIGRSESDYFPVAMINVTNRCNLECEHCFVYRDGNPNEATSPRLEIPVAQVIATLQGLKERHGTSIMLWMGGEPLLRKDLLREGLHLFQRNIITTNGTLPLVDFGTDVTYVISLDGPEHVNDATRGSGVYRRVMRNVERLPEDFSSVVQVQCTVTVRNQGVLNELVEELRQTRIDWMTFSFYVPSANDCSGLAWRNLEERMFAVNEVARLKAKYPDFIRNRTRSLELMSPDAAPHVTANCLPKRMILPLYLEGDHFKSPFCCYGDDVDCDSCGAWVVFDLAARAGISPNLQAGSDPVDLLIDTGPAD